MCFLQTWLCITLGVRWGTRGIWGRGMSLVPTESLVECWIRRVRGTNIPKVFDGGLETASFQLYATFNRMGLSTVGNEGEDIAVGISHMKVGSTPGVFGDGLSKLDIARLESFE